MDWHMWILELKVTPGLSGCMYVQRHCHALSWPLRAMLCAVLYIHPKFIHILEICARNVYNLAAALLKAASKFHSVPVQSPLCSCRYRWGTGILPFLCSSDLLRKEVTWGPGSQYSKLRRSQATFPM